MAMTDEEREEIENNPVQEAESPDEPFSDADIADVNDTVYMQTDGAAGVEGQKSRDMQMMRDSHMKSVGDAADGGGYVSGTGMRLADDRSWEARYNADQARRRARKDARLAEYQKRQELLDSGMYFDDGRGGVKLKKQFREVKRQDSTRRGWHVDTLADTGTAANAMRDAGQRAYNMSMDGSAPARPASTQPSGIEFENAIAMKRRAEEKQSRYKRNAKDNWRLFEGLSAALEDLNNGPDNIDGRVSDEKVEDRSKPPKREAIKDDKGAIMGYRDVYEKKGTKMKFRNGYVDPETIQSINDAMNANGNTRWRLKGIVAQRKFNPSMPNQKFGTTFLVNGERWDKSQGRMVPFARHMTLDEVYDFGVQNGKDSGEASGTEEQVARKVGDVRGYLKKIGAPTEKERIAAAKNATNLEIAKLNEAGRMARNDANLEQKRLDLQGRLVTEFVKLKDTDSGQDNMARKIPQEAWKALCAKRPMRDEKTGEIVRDPETDQPVMVDPTTDEVLDTMKKVTDWMKENFGKTDDGGKSGMLLDLINRLNGNAPQGQAAQAQGGNSQPTQNAPDAGGARGLGGVSPAALNGGGGAERQNANDKPLSPEGQAIVDEYTRQQNGTAYPGAPLRQGAQSADIPVPSPTGESSTTHNGKSYEWGWNEAQRRWAWNLAGSSRSQEGGGNSKLTQEQLDAAYAAEDARRSANGMTMQSAAPQETPPKYTAPLSKTRPVDIPAAVLTKAGRAIGRAADEKVKADTESAVARNRMVQKGLQKGAEAVKGASNAAQRTIGEAVVKAVDYARDRGNLTPEDIFGGKKVEQSEEGRRAQEYYRKKMEEDERRRAEKLNSVFDAIDLAASHGDRTRRAEAIAQVNEYSENLRKARAEKSRNESERKRIAREEAKAKYLQRLIESGDTDKIREEVLKDTELAALIDDVFGESKD